jgi:SAM-dependent methyltransferase
MARLPAEPSPQRCSSCGSPLDTLILDLGRQPVADELVAADAVPPEAGYPLGLAICSTCLLVQLAGKEQPSISRHGHGAAYSPTVLGHLASWATNVMQRTALQRGRLVVDVAAADGHLLAPFSAAGQRVVALEVDTDAAGAHLEQSIPTFPGRIGRRTAELVVAEHGHADLVLVNHALAHVDDLDDAVAGLATLLAPGGTIAIEAHHVLGIVAGGQFDIVTHAHRTYLSLVSLELALARHGLTVAGARTVDLHGGSLQLEARRADDAIEGSDRHDPGLLELRRLERTHGLDRLDGYAEIEGRAVRALEELRSFLVTCAATGLRVLGYGAPTRGTTLFNSANVTTELVEFTVDRDPAKQGRLLPGCRIPIRAPAEVEVGRPDRLLILPWPLRDEIMQQMSVVRTWGGRFVVPLPTLMVLD